MADDPASIFVYGTLCDAEIRRGVLGRDLGSHAVLAAQAGGFRTVYYPGETFPALVPHGGSDARGFLLCGLTRSDLVRLDAFEDIQYARGDIAIETAGGTRTAQAYFPTQTISPDARPWSLEVWRRTERPAAILHYRATEFSGQ